MARVHMASESLPVFGDELLHAFARHRQQIQPKQYCPQPVLLANVIAAREKANEMSNKREEKRRQLLTCQFQSFLRRTVSPYQHPANFRKTSILFLQKTNDELSQRVFLILLHSPVGVSKQGMLRAAATASAAREVGIERAMPRKPLA